METKKQGNCWTAYFDPETGRCFAEIIYTSREGREQYNYEITREVFDRLGGFADDVENERLIKTAKMTYSFENTMYGTLGPERTVWDEDANETMAQAVKKHNIRKARKDDLSRIAEILVFVKRMKYRPIFQDDSYSFGELQVLRVAEKYGKPEILDNILVYDDGIVKGMIRIGGNEIVELYVDYFFQNQGVGAALIEYAKQNYPVTYLWALEKNTDAIRFYAKHGFLAANEKKFEEGTAEYLVRLELSRSAEEGKR